MRTALCKRGPAALRARGSAKQRCRARARSLSHAARCWRQALLPRSNPARPACYRPCYVPRARGQGQDPGKGWGSCLAAAGWRRRSGRAADPFAVIEASAILLCASELQEELAAFMPEASGAQRLLPPVCTLPASHPDAPPQDSQRPCTPAGSPGLPGCEAPGSSAAPSAQQSSEVQGLLLRDFVDLFGSPDCQQPDNPPAASLGRGDSELGRAAAAVAGPQAAQGSAAPAGAGAGLPSSL